MGTVHKFKRPPKNRGQFKGWKPEPPRDPRGDSRKSAPWWRRNWLGKWLGPVLVLALAVGLGLLEVLG